jgi:hypothetical protein
MKTRKIIAATLVLLLLLQLLTACAGARYGATLYSDAGEWINEAFAKENRVKRAQYPSEKDPYKVTTYSDAPSSRLYVVKTREEYERIFQKNIAELSVDFEQQMIVVYTFTDYNRRENVLINAKLEEGTLRITYEDIPPHAEGDFGDSCSPYQRWFVVTLDRLDVDANSVSFVENE